MDKFLDPNNPKQFLIVFICLWLFISVSISYISGWWSLSQYYQAKTYNLKRIWRFQSVIMRMMTRYGGCINVGVTDKGLFLSVLFLFRVGHPPLLIPWEDISVERYNSFFIKGVKLRFSRVPNVPLRLREKLARNINSQIDGKWNEVFTQQ